MPWKCDCGFEEATNGKKYAAHMSRNTKLGHKGLGWVDPESGTVLGTKPRSGKTTVEQSQTSTGVGPGKVFVAKQTPTPDKETHILVDPSTATILRATPVSLEIPYTQQMWSGFQCARLHGFPGGEADWFSLISVEFWSARGINPFEMSGVVFESIQSLTQGNENLRGEEDGIKAGASGISE